MPLPILRDRSYGFVFKTFFVYSRINSIFTKPNLTQMNTTQMVSCTTTTALNSQKTSNCRGTISIVIDKPLFCYGLSNHTKGLTMSNFILCDSIVCINNSQQIKSPFDEFQKNKIFQKTIKRNKLSLIYP